MKKHLSIGEKTGASQLAHEVHHLPQSTPALSMSTGHHDMQRAPAQSHQVHSSSKHAEEDPKTFQSQLNIDNWNNPGKALMFDPPRWAARMLVSGLTGGTKLEFNHTGSEDKKSKNGKSEKAEVLFNEKTEDGVIRTGTTILHVNTKLEGGEVLRFWPEYGHVEDECKANSLCNTLLSGLDKKNNLFPTFPDTSKFIKWQSKDIVCEIKSDCDEVCREIKKHRENNKEGDPPRMVKATLTYSWEVQFLEDDQPHRNANHVV